MAYPDPYQRPRRTTSSGAGSSSPPVLPAHAGVAVPARHRGLVQSARGGRSHRDGAWRSAADEKATIELFEESRASVVYITTAQLCARRLDTQCLFHAARHRFGLYLGRCRPRRHQLPRHPGCF